MHSLHLLQCNTNFTLSIKAVFEKQPFISLIQVFHFHWVKIGESVFLHLLHHEFFFIYQILIEITCFPFAPLLFEFRQDLHSSLSGLKVNRAFLAIATYLFSTHK